MTVSSQNFLNYTLDPYATAACGEMQRQATQQN